jgi:hypothetical protein
MKKRVGRGVDGKLVEIGACLEDERSIAENDEYWRLVSHNINACTGILSN